MARQLRCPKCQMHYELDLVVEFSPLGVCMRSSAKGAQNRQSELRLMLGCPRGLDIQR